MHHFLVELCREVNGGVNVDLAPDCAPDCAGTGQIWRTVKLKVQHSSFQTSSKPQSPPTSRRGNGEGIALNPRQFAKYTTLSRSVGRRRWDRSCVPRLSIPLCIAVCTGQDGAPIFDAHEWTWALCRGEMVKRWGEGD